MPKRSNKFQALVYRIESAFHEASARVEESALVLNEATGKREEIDVLASFEVGGRVYRTGVAVRERTRDKGDKEWIRALSVQRTQCKLDRIIAVHSRGFTSTATKIARECNAELIHPNRLRDEKLRDALLPVDGVDITRFRFHTWGYQSRAKGSPPISTDDPALMIPGGSTYEVSELKDMVKSSLLRQTSSADMTESDRKHFDSGNLMIIRFRIPLADGAALSYPSGQHFRVSHMVGEVEMQHVHARFDVQRVFHYAGSNVLVGEDPRFEDNAHLTIVPNEGAQLKVQATVPLDPGNSVSVLEFPEFRVAGLSDLK